MNEAKERYETQKLMIDGKLRDVEIYKVPEFLKQVPGADCRKCAFFGTMKAYELGLPYCWSDEVAEADKDGRLVVMPCKIGDKLYRVFAGEIFEHRVGTMKYFAIQGRWGIETYPFCPCVESSIGKTVFLTREEAEKAMESRKDG